MSWVLCLTSCHGFKHTTLTLVHSLRCICMLARTLHWRWIMAQHIHVRQCHVTSGFAYATSHQVLVIILHHSIGDQSEARCHTYFTCDNHRRHLTWLALAILSGSKVCLLLSLQASGSPQNLKLDVFYVSTACMYVHVRTSVSGVPETSQDTTVRAHV
jgi:hypothetical protein